MVHKLVTPRIAQRQDQKSDAKEAHPYHKEDPPDACAEIIFRLDDDRVKRTNDKKRAKPEKNAFVVHQSMGSFGRRPGLRCRGGSSKSAPGMGKLRETVCSREIKVSVAVTPSMLWILPLSNCIRSSLSWQ